MNQRAQGGQRWPPLDCRETKSVPVPGGPAFAFVYRRWDMKRGKFILIHSEHPGHEGATKSHRVHSPVSKILGFLDLARYRAKRPTFLPQSLHSESWASCLEHLASDSTVHCTVEMNLVTGTGTGKGHWPLRCGLCWACAFSGDAFHRAASSGLSWPRLWSCLHQPLYVCHQPALLPLGPALFGGNWQASCAHSRASDTPTADNTPQAAR